MDRADFDRTVALLRDAGHLVGKREFHEWVAGSWYVEVLRDGEPHARIVWDGRDRWLCVQQNRPRNDRSNWIDTWVEKRPSGQTATTALKQLEAVLLDENDRHPQHSVSTTHASEASRVKPVRWVRVLNIGAICVIIALVALPIIYIGLILLACYIGPDCL
jgi:hypothetical protein